MDLATADLTILGRITTASNATLLCELGDGSTRDTGDRAVYKPVRGEAPLWDFPDGTLAGREVSSYLISEALGWGLIPETVLRDGPLGPGMVQRWIDEPDTGDDATDLVDIFDDDAVPADYLPVFTGYVEDSAARDGIREVVLAHADDPRLRRMAVLDVLLNNADRKGGHILTGTDGRLFGVDHGICLHAQPKLRTVLWGWAGRLVAEDMLADIARFADAPPDLTGLITDEEQEALVDRARLLGELGTMPLPDSQRPIPWPPF
ncbi:SCO1664 family protein [Tsukamurella strandjordii]|uniref:SCO1664 family protein n=1 Tax=Tsukamurella strandjordii TaxID=147577 RepID=A0AA90S7J7_9ACTN|nr:SCO1664 family protein [Tsukamurella strandjordii]MDP0397385.1 SCO1664 family protein [Tsukamurella strandjordii]